VSNNFLPTPRRSGSALGTTLFATIVILPIFVAGFVVFLIAPFAVLLLAAAAYGISRRRASRPRQVLPGRTAPRPQLDPSRPGFGSGV
jgi:hypothetical protein